MNPFLINITLIIPTYNRNSSLIETINSYLTGEQIPNQIIIADQSDEDVFFKNHLYLEECKNKYCRIDIIHFKPKAVSISIARNESIRLSNNDIIVFSDDDVTCLQNTIKDAFEIMSQSNISMLGGVDLNNFGERKRSFLKRCLQAFCGIRPFRSEKCGSVSYGLFGNYPKKFTGVINTEWTMGYFCAIKKSLISKSNIWFDEKLLNYSYGEDLDFSFRYYKWSKTNNFCCVLSDKVSVYHNVSKEFRISKEEIFKRVLVNRSYFANKYFKNHMFKFLKFKLSNSFYTLIMRHNDNTIDYKKIYKRFKKHNFIDNNGNLNYDF